MEKEKCHIGAAVNATSRKFHRSLERVASEKTPGSLTGIHSWIIHYIYTHGEEPVYQRDIEKALGIRRSSVTGLLQLMEKNGMIRREAAPFDARLKRIVLTKEALAVHEAVGHEIEALEKRACRGMSVEEVELLLSLLERVRENLDEENEVTV